MFRRIIGGPELLLRPKWSRPLCRTLVLAKNLLAGVLEPGDGTVYQTAIVVLMGLGTHSTRRIAEVTGFDHPFVAKRARVARELGYWPDDGGPACRAHGIHLPERSNMEFILDMAIIDGQVSCKPGPEGQALYSAK